MKYFFNKSYVLSNKSLVCLHGFLSANEYSSINFNKYVSIFYKDFLVGISPT